VTSWPEAQCRDLTVACLALLRAAATGSRAPAGEMATQLEVLRGDRVWDEVRRGGPLGGIPGWLASDEDSGLTLILSAATQPHVPADADESVPAEVARLLGDDFVGDLLGLGQDVLAAADGNSSVAPPTPLVVLVADSGCVATSLWPTDHPISRHPWFCSTSTLTDLSAKTVAAVRRALSPFESLAGCDVETELGMGYVWPTEVPGQPILGLRSALVALARIAGLSAVPPSLVAIGDNDEDGTFRSLSVDEALAQAGTVAHLACDVLVPATDGWRLTRPDETVVTIADADRGLDAAAQLVWGSEWAEWKRNQHRTELVELGWVPVDWEAVPPNQPIPETDVSQVDSLYAIFHEGRKVAVLGGTKGSGKSVIVRRLAARLARRQKHPPLTRIVASTVHELPDRQLALRVGRHALEMDEAASGQRRFLVLEDLHPVGDGNVDDLLPYLSRSLGASVLAVLQYDVNSNEDWQTDHVNVVTAVVGRQAMREFVARLCHEHPESLNFSAGMAELSRLNPPHDVWRLIQIMLPRNDVPGEDAGGPAHDSALAERFGSLGEAAREALATAAAWSLARSGVECELLDILDPEDLAAFGVQPEADGSRRYIASPDGCQAILAAYGASQLDGQLAPGKVNRHSAQVSNAVMADLLLPRLSSLLRDGSPQALTCLRGIRLYRNALCAEIIRRAWKEGTLPQWVQQAHPADVAKLLVSLNVWLNDEVVHNAVSSLAARLREQADWVNLQDTLVILRCLRAYLSEITPHWRAVSTWIHDQAVMILTEGSGSPDERFQLLRRVEAFHDSMLKQLVAERAVEILPGLDSSRADDYYLVRRVRSMQNRAELALRWDQQHFPIDQEEAVQGLLNLEPPDNAGFHVVLGWLILRRYFRQNDWEGLLNAHESRFAPSMRYTSSHEFSRAVDELHSFGTAYGNFLFMRALRINPRRRTQESRPFFDAVRKLLRESTPIEAADLIRSISSVQLHAAYALLSRAPDVPDDELASAMADLVYRLADTKGAGMLLSAAHAVDDIHIVKSIGFACRFGEHLGEERALKMLRDDPRPSTKYYLIKGLWEAQVPFRRACLEATRDVVVDAMTGSRKPWGPRLALQVGADAEMGEEFLSDLREHISLETILDRMDHHSSPEAQAEFHRLGRALYPEAADRYTREFQIDTFLGPLAAAAPVPAIECCREVGRTLADAGYHDAAQAIVTAADRVMDETDAWANRLARTRTGEELAQALNILLDIDRPTARSVVAALGQRIGRTDDEEGVSLLVWKARQAMFDSPMAAASLLKSLEDTEAGLGRLIYNHIREDPVLLQVFTYELQLLQSPSVQYATARQLAAIGILPGRTDTEWMSQTFRVKLQLIPIFSAPRALADIIRMLTIWNETWGYQAAKCISHSKLSARLRLGLSRDLSPAVGLAGLLYDLHDPTGSGTLLAALSEFEPVWIARCVGLREACMLLDLVRVLQPQQAGALAAAIDTEIGSYVSRAVVLDEREQWMEVGYACHSLKEAGFPVTVTDAPHTAPNIAHPAAVVWGLLHLPDTEWRRRPLATAAERLFAGTPNDGIPLFCRLAAASGLGRLSDVGDLAAERSRLARFSFRQLRILHELAERDARLAELLAGCKEEIQQRLAEPAAAISWDAQRLAESLFRLAKRSQDPTATGSSG
jgi:hypothetical protein